MNQRIPHLTFHTTFSQSNNPWKTSSCKTTQTHIHDPNFSTTHMNLLTLHLEALTGGFEVECDSRVHSNLFFIRNSAQPQANQTLHFFFWIWTLQIFTVFGLHNLLEHLTSPLEWTNCAQVKVQLPSHYTPDPADVSLVFWFFGLG